MWSTAVRLKKEEMHKCSAPEKRIRRNPTGTGVCPANICRMAQVEIAAVAADKGGADELVKRKRGRGEGEWKRRGERLAKWQLVILIPLERTSDSHVLRRGDDLSGCLQMSTLHSPLAWSSGSGSSLTSAAAPPPAASAILQILFTYGCSIHHTAPTAANTRERSRNGTRGNIEEGTRAKGKGGPSRGMRTFCYAVGWKRKTAGQDSSTGLEATPTT